VVKENQLFIKKSEKVNSLDGVAILINASSEVKRYFNLLIDFFAIIAIVTTILISIIGFDKFLYLSSAFFLFFILKHIIYIKLFKFQIEKDHIRVKQGILETKFSIVHKKKVHDIITTRSLLEKLLNRNTVIISTSGSRKSEVIISGIDNGMVIELEKIFPKNDINWSPIGKLRGFDYVPLFFSFSYRSFTFSLSMIILSITLIVKGVGFDLKGYMDTNLKEKISIQEKMTYDQKFNALNNVTNSMILTSKNVCYFKHNRKKNKEICEKKLPSVKSKLFKDIKNYKKEVFEIPHDLFNTLRLKYKYRFFVYDFKHVDDGGFYISSEIIRGLFFEKGIDKKNYKEFYIRLNTYKGLIHEIFKIEVNDPYEITSIIAQISLRMQIYDQMGINEDSESSNVGSGKQKIKDSVDIINKETNLGDDLIIWIIKNEIENINEENFEEFNIMAQVFSSVIYVFKTGVIDSSMMMVIFLIFLYNGMFNTIKNINTSYSYNNKCLLIRRSFLSFSHNIINFDRIHNIKIEKLKIGSMCIMEIQFINSPKERYFIPIRVMNYIMDKNYIKRFNLNKTTKVENFKNNYSMRKMNMSYEFFIKRIFLTNFSVSPIVLALIYFDKFNSTAILFLLLVNIQFLYLLLKFRKIPHINSFNITNNSLAIRRIGTFFDNFNFIPYKSIVHVDAHKNLIFNIFKISILKIEGINGTKRYISVRAKDVERIKEIINKGMICE
jgi:membrane protein YdbS with pleckstrin-like domain